MWGDGGVRWVWTTIYAKRAKDAKGVIAFCEFLAPYNPIEFHEEYIYSPPHRVRFIHPEKGFRFRPFVYEYKHEMDKKVMMFVYTPMKDKAHYLRLFVRGDSYKMWGMIEGNLHLFGTQEGKVFLLGTDRYGRDVFSKLLYAVRISMENSSGSTTWSS